MPYSVANMHAAMRHSSTDVTMTGHEVLDTEKMRKHPQQLNISIIYLEDTHCVDYGLFDGWCALDWEISQEVV